MDQKLNLDHLDHAVGFIMDLTMETLIKASGCYPSAEERTELDKFKTGLAVGCTNVLRLHLNEDEQRAYSEGCKSIRTIPPHKLVAMQADMGKITQQEVEKLL